MKKPTSKSALPPARIAKRQVAGWFPPEVSRALHHLAIERDSSLQALLAEAIDDLLHKHGKPRIALPTRRRRRTVDK
jgi:hypothetical protein